MGVVYKGFDPVISRSVALKTIRKDLLDGDLATETVNRFRNEAMASGRLNHPGIIAIHEYGEDGDTVFIVMEYAPGDSLRGFMSRRDSIRLTEVADIMTQLLDALDYAHEAGIVHRDIKPANIIVSAGGRLKVTDFGIARISTSTLTQTGMIVGTPSYMAPEQYTGMAVDRRADIFSSGVLFYELLTGSKPFEGSTEVVAYQICHEPHRPPSQLDLSLPRGLDDVMARALAKKPEGRFATARAFSAALNAVIEQHERISAEPTVIATRTTPVGTAPSPPSVTHPAEPSSHSTALIGWDPSTLALLETLMAPFVGPLARTMVKRYAAKSFTLSDLQEKLTQSIDDPNERTEFSKQAMPVFNQLALQKAGPGTRSSSMTMTHRAITQPELDRAVADLTPFMGPISKVLVKKDATAARDLRELYLRLAEHLATGEEKARFLKIRGFG
jgi:serine/threonine-protein kinase